MKVIQLLTFFISGNHSSALTTRGISRTLSNHAEMTQNTTDNIPAPPVKKHLWLGLAFNAFTCGVILGTVIYHLIPHVERKIKIDFVYNSFVFEDLRYSK